MHGTLLLAGSYFGYFNVPVIPLYLIPANITAFAIDNQLNMSCISKIVSTIQSTSKVMITISTWALTIVDYYTNVNQNSQLYVNFIRVCRVGCVELGRLFLPLFVKQRRICQKILQIPLALLRKCSHGIFHRQMLPKIHRPTEKFVHIYSFIYDANLRQCRAICAQFTAIPERG